MHHTVNVTKGRDVPEGRPGMRGRFSAATMRSAIRGGCSAANVLTGPLRLESECPALPFPPSFALELMHLPSLASVLELHTSDCSEVACFA